MKRILYMLDYGTSDTEALRLMRALSDAGEPELTGLYVEDEDLERAMRLPGLAEVNVRQKGAAALQPGQLQQDLRAHADTTRSLFERSASRLDITCTFRRIRGRTGEAVVDAAATSDLVVVTRPLRAFGLRARQAAQFDALIRAHSNVFFVNEPWSSGSSIVVLVDGEAHEQRHALRLARRLAEVEGLPLVAGSPVAAPVAAADRTARLDAWTQRGIVDLCEAEDARLLVLPELEQIDWQQLVPALAERLSCSVLKVAAR